MKNVMRMVCLVFAIMLVFTAMTPASLAVESDETDAIVSPMGIYKCMCIGNGVNVRTGPSTSDPSYGVLNYGEIFYRHSYSGDWWYGLCAAETSISQYYGYSVAGYVYGSYFIEVPDFK